MAKREKEIDVRTEALVTVKFHDWLVVASTGAKPESKPPSRSEHGAWNVDSVTVWFPFLILSAQSTECEMQV